MRSPHISTLFPYTTLFRSKQARSSAPAFQFTMTMSSLLPIQSTANKKPLNKIFSVSECGLLATSWTLRSEEHTSELQSLRHLVCRLLLETKKQQTNGRA